MLPTSFMDELRNRLLVSSIVGRRVTLTKAGREFKGLCPFHNEKTPSFTVNDDKGFFHCFSCGAHGDVIEFEMRANHLSFTDAVEVLADQCGLEVPKATPEDREREERRATLYEATEAACKFFEDQLRSAGGKAGLDYLLERGLSEETIARFRLGWAPHGDGLKRALMGSRFPESLLLEAGLLHQREDRTTGDLFRARVIFPITDRRGRVIAFGGRILGDGKPKYVNSPATPIFDKGGSLYGLAHAREAMGKSARAIVVEGYMDVIAMHQGGAAETVAPLGTAFTERQLLELWRMAPDVLMCLDGDEAGQKAMAKAAERSFPELQPGKSLGFAVLPDKQDPDSLIKAGGPGAMEPVLAAARPLVDVAWDIAMGEIQPDTPERVAFLERTLYRRAASIKDAGVRRHYLSEFRRRLRYGFGPPLPIVMVGRSAKNMAPRPYRGRLTAEWETARAEAEANVKFRQWLEKNGVAWDRLVETLGGLGVARAKAVKGRWAEGEEWAAVPPPSLWEPCEAGGDTLALIPVWEGGPEDGALVDVIGWNLRTGDLYQRSGFANVLGASVIVEALGFEAMGMPRPVQVAADPLSWLRKIAAGAAVVLVVDWRRVWDALGGLSGLVAESVELGERLDRYVRPPRLPRPEIFVGEGA